MADSSRPGSRTTARPRPTSGPDPAPARTHFVSKVVVQMGDDGTDDDVSLEVGIGSMISSINI